MKLFFALYYAAFFLVCVVWRAYQVRSRIHSNPVVIERGDSLRSFVARNLIGVVLILTLEVFAYFAELDPLLGPIILLEGSPWRELGIGLMVAGFLLVAIAQGQMGESWRIGIDESRRTELVGSRLYRLSRNPIYLGVVMAAVGIFLATPNALTLLVFGLSISLLNVQIRLEEEFLRRTHGQAFEDYCSRVRRWL